MLQEFRVDNYKSLINVTFKPRELNLLLGSNNVGKTNLCQAMRFVAATAVKPLDYCADQIAQGRIGIRNFYFDKPTADFYIRASVPHESEELVFEYALSVLLPPTSVPDPTLQVESERLSVTGRGFAGTVLLDNKRTGVRLLHEGDYLKGDEHFVETTAPREATMLQRLYDLQTNSRANCFKRYLSWWQYYDLSPTSLRLPHHKPNEFFLFQDGGNLASVIYRLKIGNERDYRKLLRFMQEVEPALDAINFQVASENDVFMFFDDADGHRLPAWSASNGTLRSLALAYVLMVQPLPDLHPVILVEEPENGVYVGLLKDLVEMASSAPGGAQVVITTHSPYFIDRFDDRLESIFVLSRDQRHSMISQPDVEKVRAGLGKYSLGEQHFQELLK